MTAPLPDVADLRVVVPPEQRWLSVLYSALRRLGVPLWDAVLGDGRLRLALGAPGPARLRVVIAPRTAGGRVWKRAGHLDVCYEGRSSLSQADEFALRRLLRVLDRFAPQVPADLRGFAAILAPGGGPEQTLGRLFPFVTVERTQSPRGDDTEVLVRTISACNERCPFCSGPQHHEPPTSTVLACIRLSAELLPGAMLSLTGGEPTLKSSFGEELRAALATPGIGRVQVQTNAVSFATRLDPAAWPASPRLSFFVSMHGLSAPVYDRCTGTRGLLPEALAGLDRLLGAGHRVVVNTVVSALNLEHLEALAAGLPRGPPGNRPTFHVSALICPEVNQRAADYLVRYSDMVPAVERAMDVARSRGFEVTSLLSSTHASVPHCTLRSLSGADARHQADAVVRETGLAGERRDWVKAEGCRGCVHDGACLGVPRAYAERFGLDELRPVGA